MKHICNDTSTYIYVIDDIYMIYKYIYIYIFIYVYIYM